MKKISIFITATLILAACQKNDTPALLADTITAQIEQETATKTYMDANNNIRWSSGDQVVAFMKTSYGHKYQLISSFAGKTYADFELASSSNGGYLSAGTEWDHNVVYYPYSDVVEAEKTDSHYSLSVVLPAEQTYAEETFGNGAMAMVAVSENNNITFKNILGGMKLQLKGTQKVASITLQGKNSEKLSGAATVTAYTDETKPAITMSDDASTSVTLDCGAVQLNESTATEFIIALPPVLFSKGFTVTITDSDSQTYTVETDKANTVLRSSLLVMPVVRIGEKFEEDNDSSLFIADRNTFEHYFNTFEEAYYYSEPAYQLVWDGEIDFKSLAIVCVHREGADSHSILDIKDRSDLKLYFSVANDIYDENQCVITNDGSIFYVSNFGKESIGRTPIVLITLIDDSQNVICRGYVKIEIITDPMPDLTYELSVPDIVYDSTKTEYIGDQWISKDITVNSPFNDMWFRSTLFDNITDGYSIGLYPDEFSHLYKSENSSVIKIHNNGSVEHDMPEPYFINEYNDKGTYIFGIEWKFNHKELGEIDKSGTVFKGEITLQNTLKSSEFPMNIKLIITFKVILPE